MAEHHDQEKLEEQRDVFTLVTSMVFVCLFTGVANGFFELGARRSLPGTSLLRDFSLYLVPGLLCGLTWRRAGVLLGAIAGAVVRLFSVFNLGFIMPYLDRAGRFSLQSGSAAVHGSLLALLIGSAVAGAVAGLAGLAISSSILSQKRWFRWLRKAGLGLITAGIVAAGLTTLFNFFPIGKTRYMDQKIARLEKWMAAVNTPLAVVIWLGLALTAACLLSALARLGKRPQQPADEQAESTPSPGPSAQ